MFTKMNDILSVITAPYCGIPKITTGRIRPVINGPAATPLKTIVSGRYYYPDKKLFFRNAAPILNLFTVANLNPLQ
jgi:hypothetical protein